MNGNTLTTERVRSSFIWAEEESPAHILPSVLGEEFDRWLAEVKAQERDRIIKLLEEGAVLCAGGCGYFVDGGEGDPTCANCY